jgi:hypothetical protein
MLVLGKADVDLHQGHVNGEIVLISGRSWDRDRAARAVVRWHTTIRNAPFAASQAGEERSNDLGFAVR